MTIRRQPADFIVREKPSSAFVRAMVPQASRETPFAVYELEKTSLATPDAVAYLAKALGVRPGDVSYAGLKDKHAQTQQVLTVRVAGKEQAASMPEEADGPNWQAVRVGWSPSELLASGIDGNSFEVVVRDLSRDASAEMERRAELLATWHEPGARHPEAEPGDGEPDEKGEAESEDAEESAVDDLAGSLDDPDEGDGAPTESAREDDHESDVLEENADGSTGPDAEGDADAIFGADSDDLEDPEEAGWALVVVNYFGAQRFGSARHGQGYVGRELIRGDFEQALKLAIGTPARKDAGKTRALTRMLVSNWGAWGRLARELPKCPERRPIEVLARGGDFKDAFAALPSFTQTMCVEAYQSLLWNRTARLLVDRIISDAKKGVGPALARRHAQAFQALATDDEFGQMLFPPAACTEEAIEEVLEGESGGGGEARRGAAAEQRALWRRLILPILGKNSELIEPWKAAAEHVLREEGITTHDLRITGLRRPFFGEAPRPLFVLATSFSLSPEEPDELSDPKKRVKRAVMFDLPRGAYATVVLRALGQ